MADTIHFRCTFDVRPATAAPLGLANLVDAIAAWIRSKEGHALELNVNSLLTPGTKTHARATVATDSLPDDGAPELWALRYEHQDSEFSARRWRTDFGIVRTEAERWRLCTTVSNSLHRNYIGREPGQLPVTPPRVVRKLLSDDRYHCEAGSIVLTLAPQVVQVGKAHHFVQTITDPGRACPVVYISVCRATGEPLINPSRLASLMLGTGVVFVAASPDIDEELEFLMVPREFRSPNGTVRIYAPGLDFHAVQHAYRHRFFTNSQIIDQSAQEIEGQIARALSRRQAWARVRSSVVSIADVADRRRESRRLALRQQSDEASRNALAKLFEEDNARLLADVHELEHAKAQLEEDLEERDGKASELAHEAERSRDESKQLRKQLSVARKAAEAAMELRRLPRTVSEVVELMERLHGERIVFTPEARKSAQDATLDDLHVAWECLHAMATVLPQLAFGSSTGHWSAVFPNQTGLGLALTEKKATKKDSKLIRQRRILFDGREWDVSPHVKSGTKPPRCLRVHFALDEDKKRVIIGYCGDHMRTAGTKRRK